ncbi:unnamed protein product [Dovyalis caffra]|uniref:BZIP domain-containing protein n=1 Tax=Dovyalis caffra TaxID=77055 RepID=A0AAV1RGS2_9ROSI|nr:unnamed protein product [Dovyalis caffra]
MSNSRFADAKGKCSNEIGDHGDAQNHGLVSNQILDLHQSNQSVGSTFTLQGEGVLPCNLGAASPRAFHESHVSVLGLEHEPQQKQQDAGINVENTSLVMISKTSKLPRSPQPSNTNLRKRKAGMKDTAKFNKKEIVDGFQRLKNEHTSLEDEIVFLKSQCASLKKSVKRQKKTSVYLKDKNNELTDKVTDLSMHALTSVSDREIQLGERIVQLEASNEQLQARNAQLENMQLI